MDSRQKIIVYQNALGHAVNIIKHNVGESGKIKADLVLELAEIIADGALEYADD